MLNVLPCQIINIASTSKFTACFHLAYMLKKAPDQIKNFPIKFKVLCQQCVEDITQNDIKMELIIALDSISSDSFKFLIFKEVILKLCQESSELPFNKANFFRFKSKFINVLIRMVYDPEPERFEDLLWLLEEFSVNMEKIMPKFGLGSKQQLQHFGRKIEKDDINLIFDALQNLFEIEPGKVIYNVINLN